MKSVTPHILTINGGLERFLNGRMGLWLCLSAWWEKSSAGGVQSWFYGKCNGQQVIAFCGDGGISMMLGYLMTIVQYQLPVKIIVFNNRSLGMVKLEMEVAGIPDLETDKSENLKEKYYGSTFERIDSGTIVCKPDTLSFTLHDYS